MKKYLIIMVLSVFMLLYGCVTGSEDVSGIKLVNGKPEWFFSPSAGGKTGGVGVSGIHLNGKTGQKELATQRALDEIAKQMGVKVNSYSSVHSASNSSGSSVSGESSSFFTVDGKEVTAIIKEMWEDPYTHELYIWMVTK